MPKTTEIRQTQSFAGKIKEQNLGLELVLTGKQGIEQYFVAAVEILVSSGGLEQMDSRSIVDV